MTARTDEITVDETTVKEGNDDIKCEERGSDLETDAVRDPVSDPGVRAPAAQVASEETPCVSGEDCVAGEAGGTETARERTAMRRELLEFRELYPDVALDAIPEDVTASELPLAAAYALYERRRARLRERADAENERNAGRSAGSVSDGDGGHFTPDEVRRMSRDEIRRNYDKVISSMRSWT